MTQYFGKSIDDHLFYTPQPSPEELRRLNPDIEATAVALRAAEDAERIKQRLSVPPQLVNPCECRRQGYTGPYPCPQCGSNPHEGDQP